MTVFSKHTDYGDTRGINLAPGDRYDCLDCRKKLRVIDTWPPPTGSRSVLHTWKMPGGAVVSICWTCKRKRMGQT